MQGNMTNQTMFTYNADGKMAYIMFENGMPLQAAKEVIFQLQKQLGEIEDNIKAQQAAAKEEAEKALKEGECPSPDISPECPS